VSCELFVYLPLRHNTSTRVTAAPPDALPRTAYLRERLHAISRSRGVHRLLLCASDNGSVTSRANDDHHLSQLTLESTDYLATNSHNGHDVDASSAAA